MRYAQSISLQISLDQDKNEMINVPYVEIEYRERRAEDIAQKGDLATVQFRSAYLDTSASFLTFAQVVLYLAIGVIVLSFFSYCCILNFYRPTLSNPQENNFCIKILESLLMLMDVFSTLFFWYLVLMTGYWFVFFKLQERVFTFLPRIDDWWS